MLSKLKPTIYDILRSHPALKDKPMINVLLHLGSGHTSVYQTLKKDNTEVTRTMQGMPHVYDFESEAVRRAIFGKEINDELLAKVFLQGVLYSTIKHDYSTIDWIRYFFTQKHHADLPSYSIDIKDRNRASIFIRKLIDQFSFEEAKEIFERLKKGEKARQIFETKFTEKGIQLPQNEKELDEFLAKPLPRRDTMQE